MQRGRRRSPGPLSRACALLPALVLLAGGAATAAGLPDAVRPLAEHLRSSPRLLGDPGGWRSRLEARGLELRLFYQHFLAWNVDGGLDSGSETGHSASYDFFAQAFFRDLVGQPWMPELMGLIHVKGQYDQNVNEDIGALTDPIDDADFTEAVYVSELWLESSLIGDRLRTRVGFLEQQTFFDRNAYANSEDRQFFSTALDNNPLVPLPNALGTSLLIIPADWLEVATGFADADNTPRNAGFDSFLDGPEGWNFYFELALKPRLPSANGPLGGTWRLGGFRDGRRLTEFGREDASGEPRRTRGHWGAYLSADQELWRDEQRQRVVGAFARLGWADENTNRISRFGSLGLHGRGLLPGRRQDEAGIGMHHSRISDRFRRKEDDELDHETGIEAYYRIAVFPWLDVTPDVQYIIRPGARDDVDNAWLLTLRLRVTF